MDAEILKLGKELGLKGKELIDFFKESQTRAAAEAEKVRAEAEKVRAEAEKARAEAEKARAEAEKARAEAEKVREHEIKMLELQLRSGIPSYTTTLNNQNNRRVENFELAPFIDGEDDIYRYVEDFEYYAQINKWNPNNWGIYLATFLTGNALGIYARMPSNEANDYYKLKCALLPKFYNTEVKCRLMKEERNVYDKENFEVEFLKSKYEIVVSPSTLGSESFQQIIYSRESPTKGENVFSQRKVSDEKKTSPSQDLLFQPEIFAEKEATLSRDMSIPPALSKQEENEDEVFSSFSEIEHSGISIPKCVSVDTQESEERGCSVETTISSETESQIRQPRMGISEFEFESDIEFNMFDRKSTTEEKEEHERDLTVTTIRDHSLHNEGRTIKKSYLECEKDFLSYSSQDKHNSEDLDKGPVVNQDYGILIQQGVKNKKKFNIYVSPKFGEDHMDVSIKETVKFQVEENKLFNSRSEEENKQNINQSYSVTHSKEINIFKNSREVEPEPESKIKSNAFNGKAIVEKKKEEYKYALHIAKMKHDSSCHEQEAVKLIQLNCEKEFCIESLHTEHQSLPDIQMDSLISLLQDEETEAESSNYLILPSPLSYSSFSPNDDLTNEVERKKRRKRKLCERKRMGNSDNNSDKRKNLNCKYVTRITGKSSTFQIQQTRLYKYRRK
ncbi:UNVERIFIED_CONTAM: hypothetical protein RMT77_002270 [Armadillidium vulgare]